MFLHELSNTQREALMCLAARMASADARLHDDELALLSQMRHDMDIPPSWRPSTTATAALLEAFTDHRSQSIVLLSLLRLARADRVVDAGEQAFFVEAAQAFGYSRERLQALVLWVRRHEALMAAAERLLTPG